MAVNEEAAAGTTRLTLLCHAGTAATRAAAFPADEPALAKGLAKAASLAGRLGQPGRALTSPALRARQTAEALGLAATIDPALRDLDHGHWAGRSLAALQAEAPDALAAWLGDPAAAPHGGESVVALIARVALWLDAQPPGRALAVTHSSVIRAAVLHALAAPPASFRHLDVAPLTVAVLNRTAGRWRLRSLGRP